MKVGVIVDKWKGTLSAKRASQIIVDSWASQDETPVRFIQSPMSDGGEGFGEIIGQTMGGESELIASRDAAGKNIDVTWWHICQKSTGVFETSESNGLARLQPNKFHPFSLDTYGVGQVIRHISGMSVDKLFLGIGGSATNDGGFGMARAIGYKFINSSGNEICKWTDLGSLECIKTPDRRLKDLIGSMEICVACDVENPLLGDLGATEIFGPQKGLVKKSDREKAESYLKKLSQVTHKFFGKDHANLPGAGAAGGLGFGLSAFCGAKFHQGFQLFADLSDLNSLINECDIIITGEGQLDSSSLMGKGSGGVLKMCHRVSKPVIIICGAADLRGDLPDNVIDTWVLSEHFSISECFTNTEEVLKKLVQQMSFALDRNSI